MKYGNEHHSIDVPSAILYGGAEEDLLSLIPLYLNAHKKWEASTNGLTIEDMQKVSVHYQDYESLRKEIEPLKKKLEEAGDQEVDAETQIEYSSKMNKLTDLALKITRDGGMKSAQFGLNEEQLAKVKEFRKELISIINELMGVFALGLRKLDFETKVGTVEDFMSLREPEKKKLIYDVASDPQNGAPVGFIEQLGAITPVGIRTIS